MPTVWGPCQGSTLTVAPQSPLRGCLWIGGALLTPFHCEMWSGKISNIYRSINCMIGIWIWCSKSIVLYVFWSLPFPYISSHNASDWGAVHEWCHAPEEGGTQTNDFQWWSEEGDWPISFEKSILGHQERSQARACQARAWSHAMTYALARAQASAWQNYTWACAQAISLIFF